MTEKEKRFIRQYLIDLNARQAALRAGYSEATAFNHAQQIMRRPAVRAEIDRRVAAREHRTLVSADRIVREYARIAFADIRAFATWGPDGVELVPETEISDDDAAAIREVSGAGKGRIRLHDKRPSLDALARHVGLFDKVTTADPKARHEEAARARAKLLERLDALDKKKSGAT